MNCAVKRIARKKERSQTRKKIDSFVENYQVNSNVNIYIYHVCAYIIYYILYIIYYILYIIYIIYYILTIIYYILYIQLIVLR